jgi:hypothetical protein
VTCNPSAISLYLSIPGTLCTALSAAKADITDKTWNSCRGEKRRVTEPERTHAAKPQSQRNNTIVPKRPKRRFWGKSVIPKPSTPKSKCRLFLNPFQNDRGMIFLCDYYIHCDFL